MHYAPRFRRDRGASTARVAICAALACLASPRGLPGDEPRPPNVVVILADDLGYGGLGCYGNTGYRTPHLDALAAAGMRFTDFHSSGPVCSPTRAGFLTGRYQQRAGIDGVIYAGFDQNRHHGLFPSETTLAELLRTAGYATAVVGKWHLGYETRFNPRHHGFDVFRGYVSGNVDYHSHYDRMGVLDWWDGLEVADEPGYTTHLITKHASAFIEAQRARPFFLYVAYEAPHDPWQGPNDPPFRVAGKVVAQKIEPAEKQRAYREMMEALDEGVGRIVETLKKHDLSERTLVFFFSDNGPTREGSAGSLRGNKGSLWEGGIRVPAIASWPGRIAAGATCAELVSSIDLAPTLLELAGVEVPAELRLDGASLAPALLEGRSLGRRRIFWEYRDSLAMRDGPWKLVTFPPVKAAKQTGAAGIVRLFNLADDLAEAIDLASRHPERVESMHRDLRAWLEDVRRGATEQPTAKKKRPTKSE